MDINDHKSWFNKLWSVKMERFLEQFIFLSHWWYAFPLSAANLFSQKYHVSNSEIQILPGLCWWWSYPSTLIHSFSKLSLSIFKGFWQWWHIRHNDDSWHVLKVYYVLGIVPSTLNISFNPLTNSVMLWVFLAPFGKWEDWGLSKWNKVPKQNQKSIWNIIQRQILIVCLGWDWHLPFKQDTLGNTDSVGFKSSSLWLLNMFYWPWWV